MQVLLWFMKPLKDLNLKSKEMIWYCWIKSNLIIQKFDTGILLSSLHFFQWFTYLIGILSKLQLSSESSRIEFVKFWNFLSSN